MKRWIPAKEFPQYEVSSDGEIRNRKTGFSETAISKCLRGIQDNYKGYHFEKID